MEERPETIPVGRVGGDARGETGVRGRYPAGGKGEEAEKEVGD